MTVAQDFSTACPFSVKHGESLAIVGNTGGSGEALTEALARVIRPAGGKIALGPHDIHELPESVTGRRMSFASSDAYLFQASSATISCTGLKHAPLSLQQADLSYRRNKKWEIDEANKSGNVDYDIHADWIDYAARVRPDPTISSMLILPLLDAGAAVQRTRRTRPPFSDNRHPSPQDFRRYRRRAEGIPRTPRIGEPR